MKQKKKSGFWRFIFSFMPGAAEMYMGFMKSGLSMMAIFLLSFMLPAVFHISDIFIAFTFLIYVYSFFHAHNYGGLELEDFAKMDDKYIWEELAEGKDFNISDAKSRKWMAIILIVVGVGMLWGNMEYFVLSLIPDEMWDMIYPYISNIPGVVVALALILLGIKLIKGKKEELDGQAQ